MSSIEHTVSLAPHPSAHSEAVRAVEARVVRATDGMLTVAYSVVGDVSRMRLPAPCPIRRADGLWRHTCFEAFVAPDAGSAYLELNFSPSGEWASYAFSGYRSGMAVAEDVEAPAIAVTRSEGGFTIEVTICLMCLRGGAAVRIALAAVVEETSGRLSYWALEHPPDKPDFHHLCGFALRI